VPLDYKTKYIWTNYKTKHLGRSIKNVFSRQLM